MTIRTVMTTRKNQIAPVDAIKCFGRCYKRGVVNSCHLLFPKSQVVPRPASKMPSKKTRRKGNREGNLRSNHRLGDFPPIPRRSNLRAYRNWRSRSSHAGSRPPCRIRGRFPHCGQPHGPARVRLTCYTRDYRLSLQKLCFPLLSSQSPRNQG